PGPATTAQSIDARSVANIQPRNRLRRRPDRKRDHLAADRTTLAGDGDGRSGRGVRTLDVAETQYRAQGIRPAHTRQPAAFGVVDLDRGRTNRCSFAVQPYPDQPFGDDAMRPHPLDNLLAEVAALVIADASLELPGLRWHHVVVNVGDRYGPPGLDSQDFRG